MNIKTFLDSTYLKTAQQAQISEKENNTVVINAIQEAINEQFKLIMIRPENVSLAKKMIIKANSKLTIGTVISFPDGTNTLTQKIDEATKAIANGVDDLDFVCNYNAFKNNDATTIKQEIIQCTKLALDNNKIVKWIIEVAALTDNEIIRLTTLIKNTVIANFKEENFANVFIKSSTGFYKTENNLPNGATLHTIKIMLENSFPLPIKAAGGVRNYDEAMQMIKLGVKRIGTSAAKTIAQGKSATTDY